ncbi:MAG: hypothetical protein HZB19_04605 [Chloroflexi bacterium]|nr:hypothetical protein [Chloroflexota bacterium]
MKFLRFLGNEILLGTMIAVLSVFTAVASYQGSMADSDQNKSELEGMQLLNDGNAEYLTANQQVSQDYTYFDNWYLNQDERPDIAEYYQNDFSESLQAAIERDPDAVWDDQYYEEMYAISTDLFDQSEAAFSKGAEWDERGDALQGVMLILALALAFAAWASLMKDESNMRILFALFSVIMFVWGVIAFLNVPVVAG